HTSGLMPAAEAEAGTARIACAEATRKAEGGDVSLQAQSKGKITSVLAVLNVPKGTKWEGDSPGRFAMWLDETQLILVAWDARGQGTLDIGKLQVPAGIMEAVQFDHGYVLEDGVSHSVFGM